MSNSNRCIYCLRSDVTFNKVSHLIPESVCNENVILPQGLECDDCNQDFSALEQQVLRSFPGQFFKVAYVHKTKRNKKPTSRIGGGKLKRPENETNGQRPTVQIVAHSKSGLIAHKIDNDKKNHMIKWSTGKMSAKKISAFLSKIALGYLCLINRNVYDNAYDGIRKCAKTIGEYNFIPFFLGVYPNDTNEIYILESEQSLQPIVIKFPGFWGIIPTSPCIDMDNLNSLKKKLNSEFPNRLILIKDPDWNKTIHTELNLQKVM